MPYALIVDNVVVQKQTKPAEGFVEITDDVICGQVLTNGSFVNPPISKDALKACLVECRQRAEYGGITINGMNIHSDEKTEGRIGRAYTKAQADPNYIIENWTTDGGITSVTLTAAMIIAIGDALDAHIQKCFSVNVSVTAQIEAGTLTTKEQVEQSFLDGMNV